MINCQLSRLDIRPRLFLLKFLNRFQLLHRFYYLHVEKNILVSGLDPLTKAVVVLDSRYVK